jgi:DNA (cytosine-5)-methyltransferase 1
VTATATSLFPSPVDVHRVGDRLVRQTRLAIGGTTSHVEALTDSGDPRRDWLLALLRGAKPASTARPRRAIRTVDLFSGAGGLSLGTRWAIEAAGYRHTPLLAADVDADAIDVHDFNLGPRRAYLGSVRQLFDPTLLDAALHPKEVSASAVHANDWIGGIGAADVVVGGPPCQGHSNLNNRTRRNDERNELYRWMALAAKGTTAKLVVIENVPTVKSDAGDVVGRTITLLRDLGYAITFDDVVAGDAIGLPQTRKRHFLIAVRADVLDSNWAAAQAWIGTPSGFSTSALQAIDDLQDVASNDPYDQCSDLSPDNWDRVRWLHQQGAFDLPDEHRPECHRDGQHNYAAVYGRMYPDRPAPTISTGFLSPGRGRYTHPTRPRGLTPHEAARLQGFPDDFRFVGTSGRPPRRTVVARMIGDAVPPPLAFHVMIGALAMLREDTFAGP